MPSFRVLSASTLASLILIGSAGCASGPLARVPWRLASHDKPSTDLPSRTAEGPADPLPAPEGGHARLVGFPNRPAGGHSRCTSFG